jgi:hypothetical protein
MIEIYTNPRTCMPCKYKPFLRVIGRYCQANDTTMKLINVTKEEAEISLPYVKSPQGKLIPLVQVTGKITAEW